MIRLHHLAAFILLPAFIAMSAASAQEPPKVSFAKCDRSVMDCEAIEATARKEFRELAPSQRLAKYCTARGEYEEMGVLGVVNCIKRTRAEEIIFTLEHEPLFRIADHCNPQFEDMKPEKVAAMSRELCFSRQEEEVRRARLLLTERGLVGHVDRCAAKTRAGGGIPQIFTGCLEEARVARRN